ncbi:Golgi apparatus membrane protein tvp18, partial [Ascosphaera atra]
ASSIFLIFIEVPFLLRICPTSSSFDEFVRRFTTNYMRALIYLILSIVQWLSLIMHASSLIAAAVLLDIAALFYALAGLKAQDFQGSKILGGAGVAQMIV